MGFLTNAAARYGITKAGVATAAGSAAAGGAIAYKWAKDACPSLEDEVTVEVVGQPGHRKQDLYFMALSAAFGVIRRFDFSCKGIFLNPPPGMMMLEYDAADNWVRATVRYKTSLLAAAVTQKSGAAGVGNVIGGIVGGLGGAAGGAAISGGVAAGAGGFLGAEFGAYIGGLIEDSITRAEDATPKKNDFYSQSVIYSGPADDVVGGAWGFTGVIAPLTPSTANSPGVPKLDWAGKTILTNNPTAVNPKPPGDNRSRGMFPSTVVTPGVSSTLTAQLIPLIYAALSYPGSINAETFVPPVQGVGGV